MSDWWAKKLGTPQQQAPSPGGLVIGRQPAPAPVQPQPVVQQQVVQQPVQPAIDPVTGRQQVLDPNQPADAEIGMGDAIRLWQGGQAQRLEGNTQCPNCGSRTGYTNYSATQMHGTRPRPHCFECGYNGQFTQGLESNWA